MNRFVLPLVWIALCLWRLPLHAGSPVYVGGTWSTDTSVYSNADLAAAVNSSRFRTLGGQIYLDEPGWVGSGSATQDAVRALFPNAPIFRTEAGANALDPVAAFNANVAARYPFAWLAVVGGLTDQSSTWTQSLRDGSAGKFGLVAPLVSFADLHQDFQANGWNTTRWDQLRANALIGGALSIEVAPLDYLAAPEADRAWLASCLQWASAHGITSLAVLLPAASQNLPADVAAFVTEVEARGAKPSTWVVDARYAITDTNRSLHPIGSENTSGSALYSALDLVERESATIGVQAIYQFEHNAKDSGGNGLDGVIGGGVTYVPGKVGTVAISFNGTDGHVQVPRSITDDFTIAFWMKTTANGGGNNQWWQGRGLVDGEMPGAAADFGTSLLGNKVAFGVGDPDVTIVSTTAVNDDQWHHVAAVRHATTGLMELYVDGILQASAYASTVPRSAPPALRLGSLQTGINSYAGALDEVRLYNNALDAAGVQQQLRVGPGLVAEYALDGNAQDSSGFGNHGVAAGVNYGAGKVGAQAAQFNGANSFVRLPCPVANDFSIAFWVQTTDVGGTGDQWWHGLGLVDADVPFDANDFGVSLLGDKVAFGVGNPDLTIVSSTPINDGQWHEVIVSRNGTSGLMQLSVDGALEAAATGPLGVRNSSPALRLGSAQPGTSFFAGAIDEVRVYNYALGSNGSGQTTTLSTGLVASYHLEGSATDGGGLGYSGSATNVAYGPGRIGAQAAQFNGADSAVQIANPLVDDLTIAFWMQTTADGGGTDQWWQGKGLVDGDAPGAQADFGVSLLGNKVAFGVGSPDLTLTSTNPVNDGLWHHVTAVRHSDSGLMQLYVDGVLQASAYGPFGPRTATTILHLGNMQASGHAYAGALDELRLYDYALSAHRAATLASGQTASWEDQTDANHDGLPDAWAAEHSVTGANSDPDGDGLTNAQEYFYDTDPQVAGGVPGFLSRDVWDGIGTVNLLRLRQNPAMLRAPDHSDLWAGAAYTVRNAADDFGQRFRGTVTAPVSGLYTFWIASDDGSELWLSTDERKFQKRRVAYVENPGTNDAFTGYEEYGKFVGQQSAPIQLEAGRKYYIEIQHSEFFKNEHVEVAWQAPGGQREILPAQYLASFVKDSDDVDDDDLPDSWERQYGLDPTDNGSRDRRQGAEGDFDGDGLTNHEEYLLGTDPTKSDTDGDGVSDYEEVKLLGTNPLMNDVQPFSVVATINGSAFATASGQWNAVAGGGAVSVERRGTIDYTFNVPSDGIWGFDLEAQPVGDTVHLTIDFPLDIQIDGILTGTFTLHSFDGMVDKLVGLTPWLTAGSHTLHIVNRNAAASYRLQINAVHILKPEGADQNGDGYVDWLVTSLQADNHVQALPGESYTSPLCLEGKARFFEQVAITTSDPTTGSTTTGATEQINDRWYADVALNPAAPTVIQTQFEGGLLAQADTVTWKALNLAEQNQQTLTIRKHDRLRLTAFPVGLTADTSLVTLTITDPAANASATTIRADQPQVSEFAVSGTYTVQANYYAAGSAQSVTLSVVVKSADFGDPIIAYVDNAEAWTLPEVATDVTVEWDRYLANTEMAPLAGGVRRIRVYPIDSGVMYGVARIGPGGAILARGQVTAYRGYNATSTGDATITQTYPDGDQAIRTSIVIDGLPPGGYAEVHIFVAGVTFADGTTTKRLYAADFQNGVAYLDFIRPKGTTTSVCHTVDLFDADGNLLGIVP